MGVFSLHPDLLQHPTLFALFCCNKSTTIFRRTLDFSVNVYVCVVHIVRVVNASA